VKPPWKHVSYPRALAVTLGVILAITLLYGGLTSTTAFGAYNSAWDGASELRDLSNDWNAETALLQNTTTYADHEPNGSVAFVLSPDTEYTPREADRVERFVRAGGTLVVAEDFDAQSNELLEAVGAQAGFNGSLIRDERNHDTAPTLPRVENLTDHPSTTGVDRLTLNRGTPVEPGDATVLATTSNYSYLDANQNGELDDDETMRPYPVATVEQLGAGEVVAVGDPSLFINAMLERPGNRRFARNLLATHDTAVVDVSHLEGLPPLVRAQFALQSSTPLQVVLGLLLVLGLSYLFETATLLRRLPERIRPTAARPDDADAQFPLDSTTDQETLERWIRGQHPDWNSERVRRVTDRIISENSEGQHDD